MHQSQNFHIKKKFKTGCSNKNFCCLCMCSDIWSCNSY